MFSAIVLTGAVFEVYAFVHWEWSYSEAQSRTATFYSLSFAQLIHAFNLYSGKQASLLNNEITRNRYVWIAILICVSILLITYYVPVIRHVLTIQPLDRPALFLIPAVGLLPVGVI
ncbi:hypothetical protein G8759_22065 [Spirosoma aureum]|uniref:Cation-transporting P-type ATPase C-terminal domain-containing protein n=1 Tax=Spirosoma aureum TaxID=2692134 RepID=A0A6G9AS53_9BACT|nr:hypothetical protein G8759_22065 [Spirosoma aureum]